MTGAMHQSTEEPRPDPRLEELLSEAEEEGEGADLDGLFDGVNGRIDRARRGPLWWIRSRRTLVRRAIAFVVFAAVVTLGGIALPRPDLAVYPVVRMALVLASMGVLLASALHLALRPLHQPALPRGRAAVLVGLAVVATAVIAVLPEAHHAHPASEGGTGDELWSRAPGCMYFGLLLGLPVYVVARVLDRGSVTSGVLAACAAGLAGNFVLQMHCPLTAPEHQVAGHFTVMLLFVAGFWLIRRFERWLRRRA